MLCGVAALSHSEGIIKVVPPGVKLSGATLAFSSHSFQLKKCIRIWFYFESYSQKGIKTSSTTTPRHQFYLVFASQTTDNRILNLLYPLSLPSSFQQFKLDEILSSYLSLKYRSSYESKLIFYAMLISTVY
jgi:hypothetical protein